ncbi:TPA: hypothetical protein ACPQYU_000405 [Haemophilus influenzae]|uniref:hypothetical protein n=1 Tax=Haemophilus influenzae TaxID=727 RepID=UPI000DD3802D|nr:hypothetical protein [Haemophilus influenzae]MCK8947249.1 hypothetical protein [Haemophilus influenzae]MCK9047621.1 hypothetical protein [Haemophilus influenzae]MDO7266078.1 hypothetical protein [Haemophilus influenzae]
MSRDLREALLWAGFIVFIFTFAYAINKKNEAENKENAMREIELCMNKLHKSYRECKELVYMAD